MSDFLAHPFVGQMLMVLAILLGYVLTQRKLHHDAELAKFGEKVSTREFRELKERVDKECTESNQRIQSLEIALTKMERALIFLVYKNGGNPKELGLT